MLTKIFSSKFAANLVPICCRRAALIYLHFLATFVAAASSITLHHCTARPISSCKGYVALLQKPQLPALRLAFGTLPHYISVLVRLSNQLIWRGGNVFDLTKRYFAPLCLQRWCLLPGSSLFGSIHPHSNERWIATVRASHPCLRKPPRAIFSRKSESTWRSLGSRSLANRRFLALGSLIIAAKY